MSPIKKVKFKKGSTRALTLQDRKKLICGFTLIELLVVIAIIGLLSSIVFASLSSARTKGRIAAGMKFTSSLDHTLESIGIWQFEEGAGATAADSSGYGRNGTITGATWDTNSYHQSSRYNLSFNGTSTSYVEMSNPAQGNLSYGTISAWFNAAPGVNSNIVWNVFGAGLYPRIRIENNAIVTQWSMNGTKSTSVSFSAYNTWHNIAATFDTNVGVRTYLDGVLIASNTAEIGLGHLFSGGVGVMRVGNDANLSMYMNGQIDDVRVYKEALTSTEIEKLYAEGLETNKFAEK